MKVKVQLNRLQEGLRNVAGVANAKITPKILGNVLLEAKDGKVKMMASNLEITLVTSIECEIEEPGATTVQARMFQNVLSVLPVGIVEIEVDENDKMRIRCGESSFRLGGMPAKDFPKVAKADGAEFTVAAKELKTAIRKTAYAQSNDDTRRSLKGMLLDFAEEKMKSVATDGRRLALSVVSASWSGEDARFTVPKDAVKEVQRLLAEEGDVKIKYGGGIAVFDMEKSGITMYCKTIDEIFPNYAGVIPSKVTDVAIVDRARMCDMMNRAKVMSLAATPSVQLTFGNGALDSKVSGMDDGEGRDKFAIKYGGSVQRMAFNPYYIHETISVLDSDDVKIEFTGGPVVVKGEGEEGLAVIMPLRNV